MILLLGQRGDPPLRAVAAQLDHLGAKYLCADGGLEVAKPWWPGSDAILKLSGQLLPLAEVQSAYLRPFGLTPRTEAEAEAMSVLLAWADLSTARVLNRPSASLPNNSKPLQAQSIAHYGLCIPETLITTDPRAACEFAWRYGEVVYKSISGVRSIVRRLSRDRFAELDQVRHCPTQFQRYIPGDEIRVHVIGETVVAVRIVSDRDDYRYAARDGGSIEAASIELDSAVADSLRSMVLEMGLLVAGIDLRRTPTGELYCLEVNPSPAFTYYEQIAGVAIARKIAELLV